MHQTPLYILLFKVFHAQRSKSAPYRDSIGLSPGQPKLLNFLVNRGECMQKDLATGLDVEPGTISKLLNSMESGGLITRNSIPGDKRATRIALTEEGRRLQKLYTTYMKNLELDMMSGFTEEEKALFEDLLCRVYQNLTGKEIP